MFDGRVNDFAKWGQFSSDPRLYSVHDGMLTLSALKVSGQRAPYLAPIISTQGLKTFPGYGIYRCSLRYDRGHALWPAIWTLDGQGLGRENDLIEAYPEANDPSFYQVTIHPDHNTQQGSNEHTHGDFDTAFHVYELEWRSGFLVARLDGVEQHRFALSVPSTPVYYILNLAVGVWFRNWAPDANTPANPKMDLDWIGFWS